MNADDPRHGDTKGYAAGCRKPCCQRASYLYGTRYRRDASLGIRREISNVGFRRRVQALNALGWSQGQIAERLGFTQQALTDKMRNGDLVNIRVHEAMVKVFDELSMTLPTGRASDISRVRNIAKRNGWPKPLEWDDIDNPDAKPWTDIRMRNRAARDRALVDVVVVDRAMAGHKVTPTPAERAEITRRWLADGRSISSLCVLQNWHQSRIARAA